MKDALAEARRYIPPQAKTTAFKQPVTCADAGFCLSECKEAGTLENIEVIAGNLATLFDKMSLFARTMLISISRRL